MNGIGYSVKMKCRTYDCYVTHFRNMIIYVRSKNRRLFFPKSVIEQIQKNESDVTDEIVISYEVLSQLLQFNGDEICVRNVNEEDVNKYLTSEYFANIQPKIPGMDIKWPVRKGETKLSVHATGSGFYLFYNNEKALRPDGTMWHGTRTQCLYDMFYLNGWNIPERF